MLDFAGRVAIVTGSGRGLGRAHALTLASRGCRVVVTDLPARDGEGRGPAHDVVDEIRAAGGTAVATEDNIITEADKVIQAALDSYGQLDIVINNAGTVCHGWFDEIPLEDWWNQVDIHLRAGVNICRAAWPHLKQSGTGRVINTISSGVYGNPAITNYASGKAGMLGFSRSLGMEGERWNINVNCIFPNASTRMQDPVVGELQTVLKANFQPDRIAAFAAWLVHQDTNVRNEMFEVGGGLVARLAFAHYPMVRVDRHDPEAWAEKGSAVVAGGELSAVANAAEMFQHQLDIVAPDFEMNLSNLLTAGEKPKG